MNTRFDSRLLGACLAHGFVPVAWNNEQTNLFTGPITKDGTRLVGIVTNVNGMLVRMGTLGHAEIDAFIATWRTL